MESEYENPEQSKTMNSRLRGTCDSLMQDIESINTQFRGSWNKLSYGDDVKKSSRRKSDAKRPQEQLGNTSKALSLLDEYIGDLKKLKVKHTKNFIECLRNEIEILWDSCSYGEKQRNSFEGFQSECFSQELLAEHEDHLKELKHYHNSNKDLFKLVLKREKIWNEKIAFENPADGCSRFENRGGTLIKELKRYQVVEKQLPITEKEIRSKIKLWEKANKKIFLIKDSQYIKYMDNQKAQYRKEQEMKRQEKRLAKQEAVLMEMTNHESGIATKRMSVYDNGHPKTCKKFNEENLKELMKPTTSSLIKSRMPLKSTETPTPTPSGRLPSGSKLSMSIKEDPPNTKSRLPLQSYGSPHNDLPRKISKLDLSSVTSSSPLLNHKAEKSSNLQSKSSSKLQIENSFNKSLARPTTASMSKSRLPITKSRSENNVKRKGTLMTDAKKRKLKRRSIRTVEKKYLKEKNSMEESFEEDVTYM